jgi:hypothetical protein
MTDFERFSKALALTESNDDSKAWGDSGLACGRWQMHPAWAFDWWPKHVGVLWSWDTLFRTMLQSFYLAKSAERHAVTMIAMEFHLGAAAVKNGAWDAPYLARFMNHWAAVGGT